MNKLFSKLGTLLLGASLVVAGGVAVSSKKAGEVSATEAVYKHMVFNSTNNSASISGYSNSWTNTTDGFTWNLTNWNNNKNGWEFIKAGHKTNAYVATVENAAAASVVVTKVDIVIGAVTSNAINSVKLYYGTSANPTTNETSVTVSASTQTITIPEAKRAADMYYRLEVDCKASANGTFQLNDFKLYYESSTPRGEIAINELSSQVIAVGSNGSLSYSWTPASGDSATITSHSWTSSDQTVLSVSGDTYSALKAGIVTLTLNATDSNAEDYQVTSQKYFVTNDYDFAIGDNVAFYAETPSKELSGIATGNSKYGTVTDYQTTPSGVFALSVEEGSVPGSFAFKNESNYLTWTSGNSLNVAATKSANTSWFAVNYGTHYSMINAADNTRDIMYNPGTSTSDPRFACYTSFGSSYSRLNVTTISDVPVRGTLEIKAPTDKTMREGASGDLEYTWTANPEASEATIASYSWTSSNPEAISVSGDTYSAEGPGKAKLTLSATDSTGEEYTVVGSEIEVIAVVSGSYEKKTSVAVGDTITFVCEADGTQIAGVASNIGQYVFYATKPADVYTFVLEDGSETNSYALKHNDKYLSWTGHGSSTNANIGLVDSVDEYSSWTIEFNEGNAVVSNVGLDGEGHRYIAWNHGSPRFAAYKTGQTAIQLYGPASAPETYTAEDFAQDLINQTDAYCSAYGDGSKTYEELKTLYAAVWTTLSGEEYYGQLSETAVGLLVDADAKESSTDVIEVAMWRYDLITAKYALDGFITDRPVASFSIYMPNYQSNIDSSSSITIIVIVAVASMTLLGVTLVLRKRKHQ